MTVLTLLIALAAVTGTAAAAPIITDSDSNLSTDTKTTIHTFTPRAFYTCPEGDSWCGKYIGWWVGLVALGIIGVSCPSQRESRAVPSNSKWQNTRAVR
jgi:hypothetical protein